MTLCRPIRFPLRRHHEARRGFVRQRGAMLLILMFAVALVAFGLLALAPRVATQVKRDKEEELIHRGTEYARAVKKFYKKNGRYPARLEDLENTNNIRYLRRRYKDPMTKDGKWKLLTQADVMQAIANPNFGLGGGLAPVQTGLATPEPSPEATPGASPTPTPSSGFGSPTSNPIGGGGIWGVASTNAGKSLHEFGKKSNYNKWLFIYDANQERLGQGQGLLLKGPYNPLAFRPTVTNLNQENPAGSPTPTPSQ